ncbi:MAG: sigma-54-dependent Fis family transcriptional regulator [Succinivibrio sp.]|nr:sigma-54-dependent Fis family transcriptional regulator [Succinivibrio sp.]
MNQSQVLIVDDDSQLREAIVDTLMLTGYACAEAGSGEEALDFLKKNKVDMVITDVQMGGMNGITLLKNIHEEYPQLPVLLMTAYANTQGAVMAMKEGAIDYLSKPFAPEVLLNQVSRYVPVNRIPKGEPIWEDPSTGELLKLAAKVAATEATVMITGPSGSGKEILSRYVHDKSPRADGPFVAINCAAIPDTMLEATLFGYEKGAFTGAVQACPGKFEQAQGGTILLDEITEMDLNLQAKLLRVLQEKEVERLGSRKTIALDVRVIATSNRDLKQAVAEHKFREDLYYRLNVFPLRWRPLSKRPGDILPIAKFLLSKHAADNQLAIPELTSAACAKLRQYTWPGNVRELENVMQRALILAVNGKVDADAIILDEGDFAEEEAGVFEDEPLDLSLREELLKDESSETAEAAAESRGDDAVRNQKIPPDLGGELKQHEYQIILDALIESRGNRQAVSDKLGISPRTLRYKIAKMREMGMIIPG